MERKYHSCVSARFLSPRFADASHFYSRPSLKILVTSNFFRFLRTLFVPPHGVRSDEHVLSNFRYFFHCWISGISFTNRIDVECFA